LRKREQRRCGVDDELTSSEVGLRDIPVFRAFTMYAKFEIDWQRSTAANG
jgi:hypothetical protein